MLYRHWPLNLTFTIFSHAAYEFRLSQTYFLDMSRKLFTSYRYALIDIFMMLSMLYIHGPSCDDSKYTLLTIIASNTTKNTDTRAPNMPFASYFSSSKSIAGLIISSHDTTTRRQTQKKRVKLISDPVSRPTTASWLTYNDTNAEIRSNRRESENTK
jgi:hypothetical protein